MFVHACVCMCVCIHLCMCLCVFMHAHIASLHSALVMLRIEDAWRKSTSNQKPESGTQHPRTGTQRPWLYSNHSRSVTGV